MARLRLFVRQGLAPPKRTCYRPWLRSVDL